MWSGARRGNVRDIISEYKSLLKREEQLLTERGALEIRAKKNPLGPSVDIQIEKLDDAIYDTQRLILSIEELLSDIYIAHEQSAKD